MNGEIIVLLLLVFIHGKIICMKLYLFLVMVFANDETGAWDMGQANRETVEYGSDKYENSLISWTGRVTYAYKDRYLLTATARYDGSSRFGENNKWGFFPSIGLAWRASEEEFLAGNKVITNLKVRGSFGVTGNQEIGNYKSLAQLKVDNYIYNCLNFIRYFSICHYFTYKYSQYCYYNNYCFMFQYKCYYYARHTCSCC